MNESPLPPEVSFLTARPRRLRRGRVLRDCLVDVSLTRAHLIYPLFVGHLKDRVAVSSMPGVYQLPVAEAVKEIQSLSGRGLKQFILFGITPDSKKDDRGSYACDADAPVNQVLREIKSLGIDVVMHADLCLCEYTDHGHCGILIKDDALLVVDNDQTLEQLSRTSLALAEAGADIIAPSGMMDGMVGAIRGGLDGGGYSDLSIFSYAIKYASHFYGPFRDAGQGCMSFGDRKGYQMDFRRAREWQTELQQDLAQGADMVMVKPAMAYLDIIQSVRQHCDLPVGAYHVSGEYSMLHAGAQAGLFELRDAVLESMYAIKRAGADLIITYFAPGLLDWLD